MDTVLAGLLIFLVGFIRFQFVTNNRPDIFTEPEQFCVCISLIGFGVMGVGVLVFIAQVLS